MRFALQHLIATAAALIGALGAPVAPAFAEDSDAAIVRACLEILARGPRPLADARTDRFEGKVSFAEVARCRGGENAVEKRNTPWVDWSKYWAAADMSSRSEKSDSAIMPIPPLLRHLLDRNKRGIDGALMDLEYQRMELIKFNLFDNRTFEQYLTGGKVDGRQVEGPLLRTWKEMRLEAGSPNLSDVIIDPRSGDQTCKGSAIRFRTVTGI